MKENLLLSSHLSVKTQFARSVQLGARRGLFGRRRLYANRAGTRPARSDRCRDGRSNGRTCLVGRRALRFRQIFLRPLSRTPLRSQRCSRSNHTGIRGCKPFLLVSPTGSIHSASMPRRRCHRLRTHVCHGGRTRTGQPDPPPGHRSGARPARHPRRTLDGSASSFAGAFRVKSTSAVPDGDSSSSSSAGLPRSLRCSS